MERVVGLSPVHGLVFINKIEDTRKKGMRGGWRKKLMGKGDEEKVR